MGRTLATTQVLARNVRPVLAAALAALALAGGCGDSTPVAMHLSVKGMHCEGCEQAICDKLGKIDGVAACAASHSAETVDVTAPEARRDEIEAAIRKLGYRIE